MSANPPLLRTFKRSRSLALSKWHMGTLTTNLAETKDTGGSFCLAEATLVPGNEPPPHVHSHEDELFYALDGKFDVYVGNEAFEMQDGDCIFLPRFKPHALIVRSALLRALVLFTPAGIEEAFRSMSTPVQNLNLFSRALAYSAVDSKDTTERLDKHGIRILSPSEVASQLPLYPQPLPPRTSL